MDWLQKEAADALAILQAGGWVMIMLFLIAVILYGSSVSTMVFLSRLGMGNVAAPEWHDWMREPSQAKGKAADVIKYATHGPRLTVKILQRRFAEMRHVMLEKINRRLLFINTLVAAAPLAGLLGTVIGMLATFSGMATAERGDTMGTVASGIQEALITTQTGLMVALPGVFMALVIRQKRNVLEASLTRLESIALRQCESGQIGSFKEE